MKDYINDLFRKYKQKGILIDTNILLLWLVGTVNKKRISEFKRTQTFIPEDYDLLLKLLNYFNKTITTPNILTEVNSLVNQLNEPERSQGLAVLSQAITKLDEFYLESKKVVAVDNFAKFGLTDCGIIELSINQYLVLTDDFKLANYLSSINIDAINFNHLRVYEW